MAAGEWGKQQWGLDEYGGVAPATPLEPIDPTFAHFRARAIRSLLSPVFDKNAPVTIGLLATIGFSDFDIGGAE